MYFFLRMSFFKLDPDAINLRLCVEMINNRENIVNYGKEKHFWKTVIQAKDVLSLCCIVLYIKCSF